MSCCYKIYRASHSLYGRGGIAGAICAFLRHLNQLLFACHIGSGAKIGERCVIQHNGVGVVISDHAVIGNDCMIFQGVTIGVREDGQTEAPTIGDGVVVGAGAILLGGIKVGDGAKVGAGAVVLTDVKPGETVAGVPAKPVGGGAQVPGDGSSRAVAVGSSRNARRRDGDACFPQENLTCARPCSESTRGAQKVGGEG